MPPRPWSSAQGRQLRGAQRDGHGAVPPGLARGRTGARMVEKKSDMVGQAEHNLDRVEFDVIGNASTRVAALLTGEIDMIYTVPPQDMDRISRTPGRPSHRGPRVAHDLSRHEPGARRTAVLECQGQESIQGPACPPGLSLADRRGRHRAARDARPRASDLADVGAGGERLQRRRWTSARPSIWRRRRTCWHRRAIRTDSRSRWIARTTATSMDEQICTAISAMLARVGVKVELLARTKVKYFAEDRSRRNTTRTSICWVETSATYDAHNV